VAPEHDFIHGAEYDTGLMHVVVLPGLLAFALALGRS
jgi:hypothetical protein